MNKRLGFNVLLIITICSLCYSTKRLQGRYHSNSFLNSQNVVLLKSRDVKTTKSELVVIFEIDSVLKGRIPKHTQITYFDPFYKSQYEKRFYSIFSNFDSYYLASVSDTTSFISGYNSSIIEVELLQPWEAKYMGLDSLETLDFFDYYIDQEGEEHIKLSQNFIRINSKNNDIMPIEIRKKFSNGIEFILLDDFVKFCGLNK